jgi:undecaprenyl diphosphate synthase
VTPPFADVLFYMADKTEQNPNIPTHIAIIPDGNRRWAKERGLPTLEGHRRGVQNTERLMYAARDIGVKYLTGWGFSTENWKRTEKENKYLFDLLREFVRRNKKKLSSENIRFIHIGRKDRLPSDLVTIIKDLEEETRDSDGFTIIIALDYGGHDEMLRTFAKLQEQGLEPTKENIEANLDTKGIPMPDLIIRVGGDLRLSGFMSWQCAYAELLFPEMYFPDFGPEELKNAINNFGKRERRFGGDSDTYGGGTTE